MEKKVKSCYNKYMTTIFFSLKGRLYMVNIPPQVRLALSALCSAGFQAHIVGGCVRDFLLERTPADYDITTNALPEQTQTIFSNFKCIDIGKKHGTIAVIIDKMQIEITTYRIDGNYSDKRHPESVSFSSSLCDDLSRRDFTINALAYNESSGIADYFNGQNDLKNHIIRCVGDPQKRFEEDALRIMRAIRFSSQLGFNIDTLTENYIFLQKDNLLFISAERLRVELEKLLLGKSAFDILMKYYQVIAVFIPEISPCVGFQQHSKYHKYTVWEHIVRTVCNSPDDIIIKLTMLMHDLGKPECFTLDQNNRGHFKNHPAKGAEISEKILKRLKYDNNTIKSVITLIKYHDYEFRSRKSIKKIMSVTGPELFMKLIDVQQADADSKDGQCNSPLNDLPALKAAAEEILSKNECLNIKDLKINGNHLIALGASGKQIGVILNTLLDNVINGNLENNYDDLNEYAKTIIL